MPQVHTVQVAVNSVCCDTAQVLPDHSQQTLAATTYYSSADFNIKGHLSPPTSLPPTPCCEVDTDPSSPLSSPPPLQISLENDDEAIEKTEALEKTVSTMDDNAPTMDKQICGAESEERHSHQIDDSTSVGYLPVDSSVLPFASFMDNDDTRPQSTSIAKHKRPCPPLISFSPSELHSSSSLPSPDVALEECLQLQDECSIESPQFTQPTADTTTTSDQIEPSLVSDTAVSKFQSQVHPSPVSDTNGSNKFGQVQPSPGCDTTVSDTAVSRVAILDQLVVSIDTSLLQRVPEPVSAGATCQVSVVIQLVQDWHVDIEYTIAYSSV